MPSSSGTSRLRTARSARARRRRAPSISTRRSLPQRNLITDVAGVLVGHADDARLASGVTAIVFDGARGRGGRRARRRAGHPRDRSARAASHGRAHRRRGAVRRLGLRPRRRRGRAGAACASAAAALRSETSGCRSCCGAALFDLLNGGDKNWGRFPPYRDLGYAAAAAAGDDLRARHRRRGLRRHHRQPQGRARLGLRGDARRPHGRRARRGQCLRQRQCRQRAAFLGGAVRDAMASSAASAFRQPLPPAALTPSPRDGRARTRPSPSSPPTRR